MEGVIGAGSSVEAVIADIEQAVELQKELNPEAFNEGYNLVYKYDTQSFLNYYSKIFSMPALERLTGIHQKQLHHYASGKSKPREETQQKIKKALHKLGKELIALQF